MSTGNPLTPSLKAQKKSTKAGMERINNIWILFSPCTLVEVSVPGKLIMICFATFTKLPSCRKISKLEKKSFVYEKRGFRKIRCRIEKIDPRSLTKTGVNSFQADWKAFVDWQKSFIVLSAHLLIIILSHHFHDRRRSNHHQYKRKQSLRLPQTSLDSPPPDNQ